MSKGIVMNEKGFTLIEAIIAVLIITIGIIAVNVMQSAAIRGNLSARRISDATRYAADQLENLMNASFASITDTDGDGINGIDDKTAATADGNTTSSDGLYNIYWNVVENYPVQDAKMIRIIVPSLNTNGTDVVLDSIRIENN